MALDHGVQPIDQCLTQWGISNTDVIRALPQQQLTFKMLQKARKGRRLTPHIQHKILVSLQALRPQQKLTIKDLFNY